MSLESKIDKLTNSIDTTNALLEKLLSTMTSQGSMTPTKKEEVKQVEGSVQEAPEKQEEPVTHEELKVLFLKLARLNADNKTKLKELLAEYDAMKILDLPKGDLPEVKKRAEELA